MPLNVHSQTPARRKVESAIEQALIEHWPLSKLQKVTGCSYRTCKDVMDEHQNKIREVVTKSLAKSGPNLGKVARQTRDHMLRMLPRLEALEKRAIRQSELGEDLDPKELDVITGSIGKRWKLAESLTGLDVAKQVAIRKEANKDGQPVSWDGVGEIEARPVEVMTLGDNDLASNEDEDLLGDLW